MNKFLQILYQIARVIILLFLFNAGMLLIGCLLHYFLKLTGNIIIFFTYLIGSIIALSFFLLVSGMIVTEIRKKWFDKR